MTRKTKIALIRENMMALTGDAIAAVILNQFIYWSERVRDFDAFIEEERQRGGDPHIEPTQGWIYKSATELGEEIMLNVSEATIRRRIDDLVEAGYLDKRNSPHKWDRTLQYRPNIYKIQRDLCRLGYVLDGYPLQFEFELPDESTPQDDGSNLQSDGSILHGDGSNLHGEGTVPEITTESTDRNNNRDPAARPESDDEADSGGAAVVADWSETEAEAFEALRAIGIEPEGLARQYALEAPEAACRWTAYARREGLGPGYVRKHLDAGDPPPSLARPASPPPPGGTVYR